MNGTTLLANPTSFRTFQLAHRIEDGEHFFEVSYGSSFNELYYEFTPTDFWTSLDREELKLQFSRAGVNWLLPVLAALADETAEYSTEQLCEIAAKAW